MPKVAGISSKRLISLLPDEWARWVTGVGDVFQSQPIDAEFEFISRQTDALVLVTSRRYRSARPPAGRVGGRSYLGADATALAIPDRLDPSTEWRMADDTSEIEGRDITSNPPDQRLS